MGTKGWKESVQRCTALHRFVDFLGLKSYNATKAVRECKTFKNCCEETVFSGV